MTIVQAQCNVPGVQELNPYPPSPQQADKATYDACTIADPVEENKDKKFTSEALTNGLHYFVCSIGNGAHCNNGMKATIEVKDKCP